jgi:hypothetical protein
MPGVSTYRAVQICGATSNFLFDVLDMVKPSEDPAFNVARELEMLVSLWRQEIPCAGELGYDEPRSEPR